MIEEKYTFRAQDFPRAAGILMPISCLPSRFGIGCLDSEAYHFVDFLARAGQKYWQILPISQTSYGDSPYQSFSAFAGNPYFIDLGALERDGLFAPGELVDEGFYNYIDYGVLYYKRYDLLRRAYSRFCGFGPNHAFDRFCAANAWWIEDYAIFMAIKDSKGGVSWLEWENSLRKREPQALAAFAAEHGFEIGFWKFVQWKFFEQWESLHAYARSKGIKIIGDIPIYVAMDSADLWANSSLFLMDEELRPTKVAGVPPDYFSATGQLWGNPIYNWDAMERDNFAWWRKRISFCANTYDVIRVDHFVGTVRYYTIDADAETAIDGKWQVGPGLKLLKAIDEARGDALIIAEDLGEVVPVVRAAQLESGFPGMKVMQFGFDSGSTNVHLPIHHSENCVVYTGTHDNNTLVGWLDTCDEKTLWYMRRFFGVENNASLKNCVIRSALGSVAHTCIIPMSDWLGLGGFARLNTPSVLGGNWHYRIERERITPELADSIYQLTEIFGRCEITE